MTIYFVGVIGCYEEHCREVGIPRERMGRDIICATVSHALKGKIWKDGDVITVCSHCMETRQEHDVHRYDKVFDQLDRMQTFKDSGTSWRKIGYISRQERGH